MNQPIFRPPAVTDAAEGIITAGVDITAWSEAAGIPSSTDRRRP
ncbi:hypothetical protein OED01_16215 [Microbacterium sp. M28]|nr:hypothetical protein [Microbacterium sp. M28]UYO97124.1 hypothetical protein OED01_16215 [Microbacterium sp. M28]